jgi:hypothetical protein
MSPVASAAGAAVNVDSSCLNGDGVIDITLHHVGKEGLATFRITDPRTDTVTEMDVEPSTGLPVSFDHLPDGTVTVHVLADGTDASFSVEVACDPLGAASCATDTSGQRCVASGLPLPQGAASPAVLPATGGAQGLWIGVALVACGAAASLVSRRRHH